MLVILTWHANCWFYIIFAYIFNYLLVVQLEIAMNIQQVSMCAYLPTPDSMKDISSPDNRICKMVTFRHLQFQNIQVMHWLYVSVHVFIMLLWYTTYSEKWSFEVLFPCVSLTEWCGDVISKSLAIITWNLRQAALSVLSVIRRWPWNFKATDIAGVLWVHAYDQKGGYRVSEWRNRMGAGNRNVAWRGQPAIITGYLTSALPNVFCNCFICNMKGSVENLAWYYLVISASIPCLPCSIRQTLHALLPLDRSRWVGPLSAHCREMVQGEFWN